MGLLDWFFRRDEVLGTSSNIRVRSTTPDGKEKFDYLKLLESPGFEPFARHWNQIAPKPRERWSPLTALGADRADVIRCAWYWHLRVTILAPVLDGSDERYALHRDLHREVCEKSCMTREEYETLAWYPLNESKNRAARRIRDFEVETLERMGYEVLEFDPFPGF